MQKRLKYPEGGFHKSADPPAKGSADRISIVIKGETGPQTQIFLFASLACLIDATASSGTGETPGWVLEISPLPP
jgi:hypothetical protein